MQGTWDEIYEHLSVCTQCPLSQSRHLPVMGREELYITNIIKCHPPGNRDPNEEEKKACFPYLKYETYLLKPKIIVCLGRVAAQRIIAPDFKITRQHGTLHDPSTYELVKEDFLEIVKKRSLSYAARWKR